MGTTADKILKEALNLPASERAALAEELLSSLDKPDPEIDRLWAQEAEARIDAAEQGEVKTVAEEDVFEPIYTLLVCLRNQIAANKGDRVRRLTAAAFCCRKRASPSSAAHRQRYTSLIRP